MQAITQFNLSPEDVKLMFLDVLKQASGQQPTANGQPYITPADLPDLSAADAARVLGISPATLAKLVERWPEHIKPITAKGKSARYSTEQILKVKGLNLKNRKP